MVKVPVMVTVSTTRVTVWAVMVSVVVRVRRRSSVETDVRVDGTVINVLVTVSTRPPVITVAVTGKVRVTVLDTVTNWVNVLERMTVSVSVKVMVEVWEVVAIAVLVRVTVVKPVLVRVKKAVRVSGYTSNSVTVTYTRDTGVQA